MRRGPLLWRLRSGFAAGGRSLAAFSFLTAPGAVRGDSAPEINFRTPMNSGYTASRQRSI